MNNIILQKLIEWANEIEKLTESEEIIDIDALGTKIFDYSKNISLDIMAAAIAKINRRIRIRATTGLKSKDSLKIPPLR